MDKTIENIIFENKTFNTECPVCFEKEDLVPLSCFHLIHLECAKNLISLVCPICDSALKDLPEEIHYQIKENEKKYQEELEEEDRRSLEEQLSRRQSLISNLEMVIQPPPSVEILAAIQYARSMGIPLECIPSEMKVSVPEGAPRPFPGTWFQITVGHAMERMREVLRRQESDSDDEDEYEDEDENEDEDPFEEENRLLEHIPRPLEFHDNSRRRR